MHRSWRARLGASLFAIWLALVLVEPAAIHTCAVHTGVAPIGHAGHAAHTAHGHDRADDGSAPGPGGHDHQCTCVGQCCDASTVVALVTPRFELAARPAATQRQVPAVDRYYRPTAADHLLPFEIGPPGLA